MSSLNATLLSELQAIRAEMLTLKLSVSSLEERFSGKMAKAAPAPSAPAVAKKAKDPSAPKREPTAWRLFADRVRSVLREAGFSGSALGTECVQFASSLKEEKADFSSWSDADILARRAAWVKPEVSKQEAAGKNKSKKSSTASVASGDADGEAPASDDEPAKKVRKNPWAGLSEEAKAERVAKMKAGKAAKKAAAPSDADEEAPASDGESAPAASVASSEKKKRGPKKFTDMTPEELAEAKAKRAAKKEAKSAGVAEAASGPAPKAALPPLPASPTGSAASALEGFQRVMLSGQPLWVNLTTGHAYNRLSDGGKGEWAGIFHRTPKPHIDDSVAEPVLTFTDLDALD
jgi:hypothetical protein